MLERAWSMPLEGDRDVATLFVDSHGRIVVSTTREITRPGSRLLYMNYHAHRAYAITPDGRAVWSVANVHVRCQAPDGRYAATDDRHRYLVLDQRGRVSSKRDDLDRLGRARLGR